MTSPLELVVFDMAGTTVHDAGEPVHRSLQEALADARVNVSRAAVNSVMGIPKPDAIRALLTHAGLTSRLTEIPAIHQHFVAKMVAHYTTSPDVREITGATALFRRLRSWGIRVALDTGFSRDITQTIIDRLGWMGPEAVIDAAISSDEVERGRPQPDMILALMKRFAITDPRHVAKIGDTPSDLEEGTRAGCRLVIGVTEGSHTRAELLPYPHTHLVGNIVDATPILLG